MQKYGLDSLAGPQTSVGGLAAVADGEGFIAFIVARFDEPQPVSRAHNINMTKETICAFTVCASNAVGVYVKSLSDDHPVFDNVCMHFVSR